jgi:hypothetical protein
MTTAGGRRRGPAACSGHHPRSAAGPPARVRGRGCAEDCLGEVRWSERDRLRVTAVLTAPIDIGIADDGRRRSARRARRRRRAAAAAAAASAPCSSGGTHARIARTRSHPHPCVHHMHHMHAAAAVQYIRTYATSQTDVVIRQQAPSLQQMGIGSSAECAHAI